MARVDRIEVLYRDDAIAAIAKPAGLAMTPVRGAGDDPFREAVDRALGGARWTRAHRIDGGTSGIVLLALTSEAHRALSIAFQERRVEKIYHAFVSPPPDREEGRIDAALEIPDGPARVRIVTRGGKRSRTAYRILEPFHTIALLEVRPETGRRHQIRAHLSHAGCPILGDGLYGGRVPLLSDLKPGYRGRDEERPLIARPALHALSVTFPHPASGERLALRCEYPKDLTALAKVLRRWASPRAGRS
ncbi:MAG: RluA family pseudouridine synthase [Planctomycetes bacterium]|nr:RluA family pseudouridine synthase [Planctomycetota bacterium]